MSIYIHAIREGIAQLLDSNILMMNAAGGIGIPPAGVGNPNPPAGVGNLRAGKFNGPIQVYDPNNQNYIITNNGTNQPLMGKIARSLDRQASIGLSSLSRFTFTPNQQQHILTFLFNNHINVYDNLMLGQTGYTNQPLWWKQGNNKSFIDLLRNAT